MESVIIILLILYGLVYSPICWANYRGKLVETSPYLDEKLPCSLLIPFYNEQENLPNLLNSLAQLNPRPNEIILINDYSTDGSTSIIETKLKEFEGLRLMDNTGEKGKKNALTLAISASSTNIIATTDADCFFSSAWLGKLYAHHINTEAHFSFGLVEYMHNGSWLAYYQWMESRALMAVGVGMYRLGYPIMCNGANLMFDKSAWEEVGGYRYRKNIQGGDDIFLMHEIWGKNKNKISLCLEDDTLVFTQPTKRFGPFLRQRKRWAKKTGKYKPWFANAFPLLIGFLNLVLLIAVILLIVKGLIAWAVGALITKALMDYFVIISLNKGFTSCVNFPMVMQFQLFQLVYPFLLFFVKSDWD